MRTTYRAAVAATLLLIGLAVQATVAPAPRDKHDQSVAVADSMQMVQRAFEDVRHNNPAAAAAGLDKLLHSPGFAGLPGDTRYQAVFVATLIAWQRGQNDKAHDLAVQATDFAQADNTAWMIRFSTAFTLQDYPDAAHSLTMFTQRWPGKLGDILPGAILQLHRQLGLAHNDEADRLMLDELFDADWQIQRVQPSILWRDLALQHLQRDERARATKVALRVTSGEVALSMLVDKRFDPITLAHPDAFNVDRLIAAEITDAKARSTAHPEQLQPITHLQELYLVAGQYRKVLSISDPIVARAHQRQGPKTYADFGDRYNWILDNRSRAFKRQGQWDQAIEAEVMAARVPEHGAMNVSQAINLGQLYAALNRPDEAANAIIQVGELSPMGQMQLESVKLCIAVDRQDEPATAAAMSYLRAHRADDMTTWQDALLLRGQLDEAAALLIERLEDPSWRNDALTAMQRYAEPKRTPMQEVIHARWDEVVARPQVQAAMQKVGRVDKFNIAPPLR